MLIFSTVLIIVLHNWKMQAVYVSLYCTVQCCTKAIGLLHNSYDNFNLPNVIANAYWHRQTFILKKIHVEMVENDTLCSRAANSTRIRESICAMIHVASRHENQVFSYLIPTINVTIYIYFDSLKLGEFAPMCSHSLNTFKLVTCHILQVINLSFTPQPTMWFTSRPIPGKVKLLLISGKKSASLLDHISRFF